MANEKQMAALAKARAARAASLAAKEGSAAAKPAEVAPEAAPAPEAAVAAPEAPPKAEGAKRPVEHLDLAAATHVPVPKPVDPVTLPPAVNGERVVEVQILRPYVPEFVENDMGVLVKQGEVKVKVAANSTIRLPQTEATRAMRLGIALPTENTFG